MARILGIDLGERRIGLAVSTPEGALAVPLRIIDATGPDSDAKTISEIAASENVDRLVLGHPRSLDGTAGPQAQRIEAFAGTLRAASGLPVDLYDERLSTAQARRSAGAAPVDDVAAAVILQAYLDRQRSGRDATA